MKIERDKFGKIKYGLHAVQAALIFVAWALALAVLTKSGDTGGETGAYFGLCFLSVPALIYQIMVPVWPRAQRLANPYVYAVLDILFALLWFSASVAVAVWNANGIAEGESEDTDSDGSCEYFGYGDATKCAVSKASVGIGMLVFFLFAATTAVSVLLCKQYRQTGARAGQMERLAALSASEDHTKDVWSTNMEEHDADDNQESDERRKYGQIPDEDEQTLLHKGSSYSMQLPQHAHPGAPLEFNPPGHIQSTGQQYDNYVPSALSPGGYDQDAAPAYQPPSVSERINGSYGRVDYPSARYDRI